ncbi:(2Fe-2S)-binding protein [Azospirillum sp. TSH100]|uniref:FAD/NAD(P)-dependent oxidoreductase n=1 Tax=Azospirillum sp. TSH100 TaxID=652764 RepID=UPI000D60678F|nr:FAD/NAD(P)-binding oxidoreductase [Azospirillum sp. TSH100]PWC90072.1 (2Fe-2S)-binding protein [Azospirillum sp. TSH100]QCG90636.1 FAD-binding protein [Azospirillum sp. TSH100]
MTEPQVVIVGAGPAGIRAAETLAAAGLRPTVIDEGARAGGQIYRRPPEEFTRPPATLYGSQAGKAVALHTAFDGLVVAGRIVHLPRHSVVALADGVLHAVGDGGSRRIGYDRLILATGATDRLAPVPGWQAPGVYSLGAMQIALKAQGVAMGRRIVLAGSGPLLTLLATQLLKAGAGVAAVLDTAGLRGQIAAFPDLAVRPSFALQGLAMRARLGRLYHAGVVLEGIEAADGGVTAVRWTDAGGRSRSTACDAVGLGWHLKAETQLADLAGCRFVYDGTWAQWLPCADAMGRAGDGIYLAGDGLRLLGADGAEVAGRLAAAACLSDLGWPTPDIAADLRRLDRLERFACGVARAFPWPADQVRALPDDTVLCRCEGITAGAVRETAAYGGVEANRVKSLGRAGMGRCQGRYCQLAAVELIAATGRLVDAGDVGRLRAQAPVRPATIAALLEGE